MPSSRSRPAVSPARSWLGRALAFAAVWTIVSGGGARGWLFGLPAVLVAATVDWPSHTPRVHWWRVDRWVRFAGYYVAHALLGGVDVALRALRPGRSVDPGFVTVPLRLPPGPARALLSVTLSMLPGTVTAEMVGNRMVVQRIHSGVDVHRACRETEACIAPLFGLELDGPPGPEEQPSA